MNLHTYPHDRSRDGNSSGKIDFIYLSILDSSPLPVPYAQEEPNFIFPYKMVLGGEGRGTRRSRPGRGRFHRPKNRAFSARTTDFAYDGEGAVLWRKNVSSRFGLVSVVRTVMVHAGRKQLISEVSKHNKNELRDADYELYGQGDGIDRDDHSHPLPFSFSGHLPRRRWWRGRGNRRCCVSPPLGGAGID